MRVLVTGATGWIGSAVVPELLDHGHEVLGLARSDGSAAAVSAAGAEPVRGSLDDLDSLRSAASASDGVIHLAFKHEEAFAGDFFGAAAADREAIEALGEALEGSGRPLVVTTGFAGHEPGALVNEDDEPDTGTVLGGRMRAEHLVRAFAGRGLRTSSVRLAPTVHGAGDPNFVASLVALASAKGISAYLGEGRNTWPAVHRADAARLFRLALEAAPAGAVLHGAGEEGVPFRAIAEAIGRAVGVPARSVSTEDAEDHFGSLATFAALDVRAATGRTRQLVGWQPAQPGLAEGLERGHYAHALAR